MLASWAGWYLSLWQRRDGRMSEQTAAGYGYCKEWAPGILLHCVSFVVGGWLKEHLNPPPPPFTPEANTLSNLNCSSLILNALLGKSLGISFVEKYLYVPKICVFDVQAEQECSCPCMCIYRPQRRPEHLTFGILKLKCSLNGLLFKNWINSCLPTASSAEELKISAQEIGAPGWCPLFSLPGFLPR